MYKLLIRPFLFLMGPEKAHYFTFNVLKVLLKIPFVKHCVRAIFKPEVSGKKLIMGLDFPNPVGLAAGFDKDAKLYEELSCFGFGFIEIGTLTPKAQPGNPQPRMFRLKEDSALINRMGFNNEGVDAAAKRLKNRKRNLIVGGNIGKNKATGNENAISDYEYCFESLFDYVDYFVVNVSSPNTPGLRELQEKEPLTALLQRLQTLNRQKSVPKPLLLKIAPDLTNSQLSEIVGIVKTVKLEGIIATNTTISRENLKSAEHLKTETGGLSGMPLRERSTEVIRFLREQSGKEMVIIAVGGIFTAADANEKLAAGADLVQVYTGFIYEGPAMVKNIVNGLN